MHPFVLQNVRQLDISIHLFDTYLSIISPGSVPIAWELLSVNNYKIPILVDLGNFHENMFCTYRQLKGGIFRITACPKFYFLFAKNVEEHRRNPYRRADPKHTRAVGHARHTLSDLCKSPVAQLLCSCYAQGN